MKDFNKIATSLTLILKTTPLASIRPSHTKPDKNRLDIDGSGGAGSGNIKNLSTVKKLTKFKKLDFAKVKSFGVDFLTFGVKKTFIHLQKAFTKALIFNHFDTDCHICIKTDVSGYVIGRILNQMTLDQRFFNHMTHKNSDFSSSKLVNGIQ